MSSSTCHIPESRRVGSSAHPSKARSLFDNAKDVVALDIDLPKPCSASRDLPIERGRVVRAVFPPEEVAQVKAIACSLPREQGVPLSRFSRAELHRLVVERGISDASASTIARWLADDALKPWQHRSWIFPTDPAFLEKAGPVLDLYQGRWEGKLLHPGEFVICADEKPSIQARARVHDTLAPSPGSRGLRVEHTYKRRGALTYLAALDIERRGKRRPRAFGRSEARGGIESFDRLVFQVMTKDLPVHASWLNQIEIYFSIVQRKVLQPNDFTDLAALEERLLGFGRHYEQVAQPFEWKFTRADLDRLLERLHTPSRTTTIAA